jgi:hypothetical protein
VTSGDIRCTRQFPVLWIIPTAELLPYSVHALVDCAHYCAPAVAQLLPNSVHALVDCAHSCAPAVTQLLPHSVHALVNCAHSCAPAVAQFYTLRWRCSWSRHCMIARKVTGSIHEGVSGILHWLNLKDALWP